MGASSSKSRSKKPASYTRNVDKYFSLEQVTQALAKAGLESSNLILGIDFTKSNQWTGERSFNKKSLHQLGDTLNPYEQSIAIIGKTLSTFDEDNLIPCYGFGDATTHDKDVFSFYPDDKPCVGFDNVLRRYRELVPQVSLAGPTSFSPIIETAIGIVDSSGGQYHVLVIIADGQNGSGAVQHRIARRETDVRWSPHQVSKSVNSKYGQLSSQERNTINAIIKASDYPLSIVVVGVGDGPWKMMHKFDDNIPTRAFDNFQFVNFTKIMSKKAPLTQRMSKFALHALMEIPSQYKAMRALNLLGCHKGYIGRFPLPPPHSSEMSPLPPSQAEPNMNSHVASNSSEMPPLPPSQGEPNILSKKEKKRKG